MSLIWTKLTHLDVDRYQVFSIEIYELRLCHLCIEQG